VQVGTGVLQQEVARDLDGPDPSHEEGRAGFG
jgi:hypothetical protein